MFIALAERSFDGRAFSGVEVTSVILGGIIRKYKSGLFAVKSRSRFAFGDVNLGNIIFADGRIYIIDFEFAHRSDAAFDVGMLIAELDRRATPKSGRRRARQALLDGYIKAGGKVAEVMTWRNRLTSHQIRSSPGRNH